MSSKNIKKESEFGVRGIKKEPEFVACSIKKEPDFVTCSIKRESEFSVKAIKKEPEFVTSIKQEYDFETEKPLAGCDTEITSDKLSGSKTKSRRKKRKLTRRHKTAQRKICRKPKTKVELISSKKKVKTRKSIGLTSKKPSKRRKRKTKKRSKSVAKSIKWNSIKKEGRTLLDQQSSTELRLFGFKDELDYFTVESDYEKFRDGSDVTAKRTNLSRLDARNKVLLALKSSPVSSSSKFGHIIETPTDKNADLLGSILNSQALWHSKHSKMKVKEDGSVEVISGRLNTEPKDSTNSKSDPWSCNIQEIKENRIISAEKQGTTQISTVKPLARDLFNENKAELNNDLDINIKNKTPEICDDNEYTSKQKIKIEVKQMKNSPKFTSSVTQFRRSLPPKQKCTFSYSPKSEKSSESEGDDCPIFSIYSESSKEFSHQRVKERRIRCPSNESDIQIIEIKENKRTPQGERREESADWGRTYKKDECSLWKKESNSFQLERGRPPSRSRSPNRKYSSRSRSRSRSISAASISKVKDEKVN